MEYFVIVKCFGAELCSKTHFRRLPIWGGGSERNFAKHSGVSGPQNQSATKICYLVFHRITSAVLSHWVSEWTHSSIYRYCLISSYSHSNNLNDILSSWCWGVFIIYMKCMIFLSCFIQSLVFPFSFHVQNYDLIVHVILFINSYHNSPNSINLHQET